MTPEEAVLEMAQFSVVQRDLADDGEEPNRVNVATLHIRIGCQAMLSDMLLDDAVGDEEAAMMYIKENLAKSIVEAMRKILRGEVLDRPVF